MLYWKKVVELNHRWSYGIDKWLHLILKHWRNYSFMPYYQLIFFFSKRGPSHLQTIPHTPLTVPWASYQIQKIAGCACAGNAGNVFPRRRFKRKPLVSDPGMHHGTCVTHVPWCMSGSLTCGDGENVPGIPGACAPQFCVSGKRPIQPCYHCEAR